MANAGASIEAVLTLNSTGFNQGITKSIEALSKFEQSIGSFKKNTSNFDTALRNLQTSLQVLTQEINNFNIQAKKLSEFSKFATSINKVSNALKTLSSSEIDAVQSMNLINNMFNAFKGSLNGVEVTVKGVSSSVKELANSENQLAPSSERVAVATKQYDEAVKLSLPSTRSLITANRDLANAERQVASASNQESASVQKSSASKEKGVASSNKLASANKNLANSFSMLRSGITLVGSMIAYNFVHNLAMATTETINAKSEMNGYFQMLGYGKRQVDDFNNALEETIKKFPRLNKYALGETISSIGVEFELTTAEMKKAMPVVSMITSEYLRAGRNVNEASLAVKDILQGEFQRLSRETGVKGDQLKEAGWSGDKNDVMGLLEALDKVGKSRNWDTFVQKANSLNDAVLIMQNRFSEWSADLVERFQPAIVGAFNDIMVVAGDFGKALNGVLDWLGGSGLGQSIVKWGGLATAIGLVSSALIAYRTGANLTQIAQMGLVKSIIATTLGLEGEAVAEHGVVGAMLLQNEAIDVNTLKEYGRLNSIVAVVTGLEAEEVATIGKTKALIGSLAGVDMAILKEEGLAVALLESSTQMEVAKLRAMGLGKQMGLLAVSIGLPLAVIGAFTGALVLQAIEISNTTETYKKFTDMLQNGNQIINDAKSEVDSLTNSKKALTEKLATLTEGSYEYEEIASKLKVVNDDLAVATKNYSDAVNSVAWVKHKQELYDEEKAKAQLSAQKEINQALLDYGFNVKEAGQISSQYWNDAINGWDQHYETLQKVNLQYSKNATTVKHHLEELNNTELEDKEVKVLIRGIISSGNAVADAKEELGNATSLTEYVDKWFWLQVKQIDHSLKEFDINKAVGGWSEAIGGLAWGLVHAFGDNFIGQFAQGLAKDMGLQGIGVDLGDKIKKPIEDFIVSIPDQIMTLFSVGGIFVKIQDALKSFFNDGFKDFDLLKMITDAIGFKPVSAENGESHLPVADEMYQVIVQPIVDWWNEFMADPLAYIGGSLEYTGLGQLISALMGVSDGMDFTWAWDWVNNNIILPITSTIQTFMADPVSFIGEMGLSVVQLLDSMFPFNIEGTLQWVNTNIIQPFTTGIANGIASIPIVGDILSLLGLIPQTNSDAQSKGSGVGNSIGTGISNMISQIPIVGDILKILGLIPSTNSDAHGKGYGVGENIKKGEKEGHTGLADNIRGEMDNVISILSKKAGEAYSVAYDIGNQILTGIKNALDMHSPSIISRELIANEFGVYIPQAISDSGALAYETAQGYGQQIYDGINSVQTVLGFGDMVEGYESDAQIIASTSETMGLDTTTAFNNMTLAVTTTTNTMQGNVVSSYTTMQQKQNTLLTNMKNSNTTAYNEMYNKSNQSLLQMRTSTENVTQQMTKAWSHMKDQIIASANKLKTDSTAHFNQLSETIGSFYRKIQNPSNWGAGSSKPSGVMTRTATNPTAGRRVASALHGAGGGNSGGKHTGSTTMSIAQIKKLICPNGDCDGLFDGYSSTDRVNVEDFLSMISGEHGFGWNDWSGTHYNYIKNKSDQWSMKSPVIQLMGGIPTDANFKVGEFNNGTPRISFSEFQSMAGSIFSAIPYKLYYDSSWKGSWLGALQAGACNCSDGADALLAFASTCGFSGYKQWGLWGNTGHFWAVINGVPMDTTAWQGGYGWTSPKVRGYGGVDVMRANHSPKFDTTGNTVNITIEMNDSVIYGVDDLDDRIKGATKEAMREQFNDPYGVAL